MVSGTISLPCLGFFSPFPHGTSSLSVSQEYLALRDGPRRFKQDFTCPALLRILLRCNFLRVLGYHHLWPNFPEKFHLKLFSILQSYNLPIAETIRIWAVPLSLATTQGITIVFSSSGYLDVSVLRVSIPFGISGLQPEGFPHSEIHGSKGYLLLPVAYRSLSRPSSPLRAKASTIRSYLLSFVTYNLIHNLFQHVKELDLTVNDVNIHYWLNE